MTENVLEAPGNGREHDTNLQTRRRRENPSRVNALGKHQGYFAWRGTGSPQFHVKKSCICQDLEHLANELEERGPHIIIERQRREMMGAAHRERGPFFTNTR